MTQQGTPVPHDKADQLEQIQDGLIDGETVYAVYDCTGAGTGFVGVTNLRVILQDNSFTGGKSAVTSLPIRSVSSISFVSDKSLFGRHVASATLAITAGSVVHEATFRGDAKAKHVHDTILWLLTRS
ncbi:hypothetical protein Cch01nite_16110 [Cellulomonas chitinilytica]|uniref:YokE-like PH domain-containing protein n=1 Tax=Cellulomonas chitinilytica TaxID=398759 RepID=A0A919U1W3_9CELL|nr:hypothetical protein [Cellulomonas chitinilytica]GIG20887.1 hypothetical protein Cch01nite_16110 [Cellulomonas chitinilytica]